MHRRSVSVAEVSGKGRGGQKIVPSTGRGKGSRGARTPSPQRSKKSEGPEPRATRSSSPSKGAPAARSSSPSKGAPAARSSPPPIKVPPAPRPRAPVEMEPSLHREAVPFDVWFARYRALPGGAHEGAMPFEERHRQPDSMCRSNECPHRLAHRRG